MVEDKYCFQHFSFVLFSSFFQLYCFEHFFFPSYIVFNIFQLHCFQHFFSYIVFNIPPFFSSVILFSTFFQLYCFQHIFSYIIFNIFSIILWQTVHLPMHSWFFFNPFPSKPWFLRVCSTNLLRTLWEMEKLLDTVFSTCLESFLPFSISLKLSPANSFSLEVSKICRLGQG